MGAVYEQESLDLLNGGYASVVWLQDISRGSFGSMALCEMRRSRSPSGRRISDSEYTSVAIKSSRPEAEGSQNMIEKEGALLKVLSHASIVRLEAVLADKNGDISLAQEYIQGPTLQELLSRQKQLLPHKRLYTHVQAARWMLQLASALGYMHERPDGRTVIHRDVNLSNIMLTSFNYDKAALKLVDFGLACYLDGGEHSASSDRNSAQVLKRSKSSRHFLDRPDVVKGLNDNNVCGTFLHMAPEVTCCETYDEKVDCWSFAMVMYQMFHYTSMITVLHHSGFTIKDGQAAIMGGWRPMVMPTCPERIERLIKRCWDTDPSNRPRFSDVVNELSLFLAEASEKESQGPWQSLIRRVKRFGRIKSSGQAKSPGSKRLALHFSIPSTARNLEGGSLIADTANRLSMTEGSHHKVSKPLSRESPSTAGSTPSMAPPSDRGSSANVDGSKAIPYARHYSSCPSIPLVDSICLEDNAAAEMKTGNAPLEERRRRSSDGIPGCFATGLSAIHCIPQEMAGTAQSDETLRNSSARHSIL